MATSVVLPHELREHGERWVLDLERRVEALQAGASQLPETEALMLLTAAGDVLNTLRHSRGIFAGDVPLGQRPDSRWVPIVHPSPALAALVHSAGGDLGETPRELLELAKATLREETVPGRPPDGRRCTWLRLYESHQSGLGRVS
jgi:hypothetical protein